jgi:dienelactone hydrolase
MREQYVEYRDGESLLEGFLCYDEAQPGPRPTVLINHAWGGRDEFVERKARRLAWQGYACFALDNFGKGRRGATTEECSALITPFMKDRAMLLKRMRAGLTTVKGMPIVDARRIAVMGFCFGGLCALDLARSDAVPRYLSFMAMTIRWRHPKTYSPSRRNSPQPALIGSCMPTARRCTRLPIRPPTTVRPACNTTMPPTGVPGMHWKSFSLKSLNSRPFATLRHHA